MSRASSTPPTTPTEFTGPAAPTLLRNSLKTFDHSPYVPYDADVAFYQGIVRPFLIPLEYTGWRDEQMSWKETAYLHGNLNPSPTLILRGPDALRFLRDTCVNTMEQFAVGTGKHGIMCDDLGRVMSHGVLLRTGAEEFVSYWMSPYMDYALSKGDYDVEAENVTGSVFLFQLAGPRSYEILTAATGGDLSDLKFMGHRVGKIAGHSVRLLRMGMGGALSYEIHGRIEDAPEVYDAIRAAGIPFGIRRLGMRAYMMNHTENGFPQSYYHFNYPWGEDPELVEFLERLAERSKTGAAERSNAAQLRGSIGPDITKRYRTPVELGWERTVNFDHEFRGKAALEREVADPRRVMRTLVWNVDDILDVHRSQFEPGEPYAPIDEPNHHTRGFGGAIMYADAVLDGGREIGISSGRCYSFYSREMLSLASIETAYAELGTEVEVLWGDPGTRQKRIRATVSRFPYLGLARNRDVDVRAIAASRPA